jgi:hypothetical protein
LWGYLLGVKKEAPICVGFTFTKETIIGCKMLIATEKSKARKRRMI